MAGSSLTLSKSHHRLADMIRKPFQRRSSPASSPVGAAPAPASDALSDSLASLESEERESGVGTPAAAADRAETSVTPSQASEGYQTVRAREESGRGEEEVGTEKQVKFACDQFAVLHEF